MSDQEKVRLHAIVEGRVQGVGFRYFTLENANKHNLTGWVRNRWNRTVEVVAEGQREDSEKFLRTIQRGPRAFTTENVKFEWKTPTGEFNRFQIRRTS